MSLPEFYKKTQTCHQFITFDSSFSEAALAITIVALSFSKPSLGS
ncbi:MAG TPA: hypothetical protein VE244_12955 [Nitrososphaeraceae archaeon]|nr:hypothetical protein [Nitrososphaeraceae archaeon]